MKRLALILALFLTSCGCFRHQPTVIVRDSLVIREHFVHDTAIFTIEKEVEKVVTRDTSSHLENTYASSDAAIDSIGHLHHSLSTKPQKVPVPVTVTVTDTLWLQGETIRETVEVEKPLTRWQKFRLDAFWILIGIISFTLILTLAKRK